MKYIDARRFVKHDLALEIIQEPSSGIIAFGVGRRHGGAITDGGRDDFCVTAFVVQKLMPDSLRQRNIEDAYKRCSKVAQRIGIHLRPNDFRVEEAGSNVHLQAITPFHAIYPVRYHAGPISSHGLAATVNTQKWFSMLRPGIGIANPAKAYPGTLDAGTIGFFVKRSDAPDEVFLVSCNHVIARRTTWDQSDVMGDVIVQPGTMDLSGRDIREYPDANDLDRPFGIARLFAFVEIQTYAAGSGRIATNLADAALAKITVAREPNDNLSRLPYAGRIMGQDNIEWDDRRGEVKGCGVVFKCGRTTGFTEGVVTQIDGVAEVEFGGVRAMFEDQLVIKPSADNTGRFSDKGDSGSPVISERNDIVGMVIAGTTQQSWATPIQTILNELSQARDIHGRIMGPLTIYL